MMTKAVWLPVVTPDQPDLTPALHLMNRQEIYFAL